MFALIKCGKILWEMLMKHHDGLNWRIGSQRRCAVEELEQWCSTNKCLPFTEPFIFILPWRVERFAYEWISMTAESSSIYCAILSHIFSFERNTRIPFKSCPLFSILQNGIVNIIQVNHFKHYRRMDEDLTLRGPLLSFPVIEMTESH